MAITISGENNNDRILAQDGVIDEISGINIVGLLTAGHINVGSNIQLGNAGIVTATTFVGNVTGNVNSTSPLLLQTGGSERFRITGNNELGIAGANYGSSGQVLTSGGSGSAVSWTTPTTVAITSIATDGANRVLTSDGDGTATAHSFITIESNRLSINRGSGSGAYPLIVRRTDASGVIAEFANNGGYGLWIGQNSATGEAYLRTGTGQPLVFTTNSGSGIANERLRITSGGETKFTVGTNKTVKFYAASHNDETNLGAGLGFSRQSDGAELLSGIFGHSNTGLGVAARDHITFLTGGTSNVSDTEERLRIDSSGRMLLNTTTEGHASADDLTIYNAGNGGITIRTGTTSNGAIFFSDATSGAAEYDGWVQYNHGTAPYMIFGTAGDTRLRIDSSGHMGLGVTPSAWPTNDDYKGLQVGSGACIFGRGSGDEDRGGIGVNYYGTTSGAKYITNGHAARIYMADGNIYLQNAASNSSGVDAAMTLNTRLNISSGGDVTVSTGSLFIPDSIVHIGDTTCKIRFPSNDNISFETAGSPRLNITTGGSVYSSNFGIGTDDRWKIRPNNSNADLAFEYSTSASLSDSNIKMVLTSLGNVGINQNTPTRARLHVVGGTANPTIVAKFKGSSGSDARAKIGLSAAYSDTANDTEGQAYIGALRNGSGNSSTLFFEVSTGSTLKELARVDTGGIQIGGSLRFNNGANDATVMPNSHNIGDVSSNSISYQHNAGLYYVYLTCPTDGNWYTMMTSFNDSASNFRGVCGDASSKNSFYWYFNPTSPSYGVNPYGEKWHHGAWNTGSVTFRLDGTHPNWNLQIKCTSHYGTNRTAALRAVMEVYY